MFGHQVYWQRNDNRGMKDPRSLFREEKEERPISDLEKVAYFKGGTKKVYACSILGEECVIDKESDLDCRRCNIALAYLIVNPDFIKDAKKG